RPLSPPLFPYTPLFRSAVPQGAGSALRSLEPVGPPYRTGIWRALGRSHDGNDGGGALCQSHPDHDRRRRLSRPVALLRQSFHPRSEEHTSELQSPEKLV